MNSLESAFNQLNSLIRKDAELYAPVLIQKKTGREADKKEDAEAKTNKIEAVQKKALEALQSIDSQGNEELEEVVDALIRSFKAIKISPHSEKDRSHNQKGLGVIQAFMNDLRKFKVP